MPELHAGEPQVLFAVLLAPPIQSTTLHYQEGMAQYIPNIHTSSPHSKEKADFIGFP